MKKQMKKLMLLMVTLLAGLTSCSKDELGSGNGKETKVTITAQMPSNGSETRAASDFGKGENVNRCIMEVYNNGQLYKRMYVAVNGKKATFDLRLVSSQTYDFLFWADNVASNQTDEAIKTDNIYFIDTTANGLQEVTIKDLNYAGNNDQRDAFFAHKTVKVDATTNLSVDLKRPFGQLNVSTGLKDVVPALTPDKVKIYYSTKLYRKFNIMTGEVSDDVEMRWSDVADVIERVNKDKLALATDYLFAPKTEKYLVDFRMEFYKGATMITSNDNFTSIPVQRNYKTNVSGELLTKQGTIKVEVLPGFDDPSIDMEIKDVDAASVAEINEALQSNVGKELGKVIQVNMTAPITEVSTIFIPAAAKEITPSVTLNFTNAISQTVTIEEKANENYSGEVRIIAPGATSGSFAINMPNSTVYLNGTVISNAETTTAPTTFVVAKDSEITGTLTVNGGNVQIFGKVANIARGAGNTDAKTNVWLMDGAAQPVCADPSKIEFIKAESGKVKIVETNKYYATIQAAAEAVEENQTIEIAAGTYNVTETHNLFQSTKSSRFVINKKGVTIKGIDNPVIYAEADGRMQGGAGWESNQGSTILVTADNVTIDGVTVRGIDCSEAYNEPSGNKAICISSSKNFTLKNSTLTPAENGKGGSLIWDGNFSDATASVENSVINGALITRYADGTLTVNVSNVTVNQTSSYTGVISANAKNVINVVSNLVLNINNSADFGLTTSAAPAKSQINLAAGIYEVARGTEKIKGQDGWYAPIVSNDISIKGNDFVVLTSTIESVNGAWASQNFITVFGDNVTIDGVTIVSKTEPNKVIEILGNNFKLKNSNINPNTVFNEYGGSIYFNRETTTTATIENCVLNNTPLYTTALLNDSQVAVKNVTMNLDANYCKTWNELAADYNILSTNAPSVVKVSGRFTINLNAKMSSAGGILTDLLERVPEGATIKLAAGTYAPIVLRNTKTNVVVEGVDKATVLIPSFELYSTGCDITLKNITFTDPGTGSTKSTVFITNGVLRLENCFFGAITNDNAQQRTIETSASASIYVNNTEFNGSRVASYFNGNSLKSFTNNTYKSTIKAVTCDNFQQALRATVITGNDFNGSNLYYAMSTKIYAETSFDEAVAAIEAIDVPLLKAALKNNTNLKIRLALNGGNYYLGISGDNFVKVNG